MLQPLEFSLLPSVAAIIGSLTEGGPTVKRGVAIHT